MTISQDTASTKKIQLPKHWPATVKTAVLQVISLAQYATAYTRGWAANSPNARMRLKAEKDRSDAELEQTREEVRIKDARMGSLDPYRRPNYPPPERMAILALKTARGWSLEQTAKRFLVSPATVASWMKRLDEQGPHALVQLPGGPVNKFPQFVQHCVQRLKTLAPTMGKVKIAQTLARAGLHLARPLWDACSRAVKTPPIRLPPPATILLRRQPSVQTLPATRSTRAATSAAGQATRGDGQLSWPRVACV